MPAGQEIDRIRYCREARSSLKRNQSAKDAAEMKTGLTLQRTCYQVIDQSHPYLSYDLTKCCGCGRCVRYAETVACCDALELVEIAGRVRMQPRPGRFFLDGNCFVCGGCAEICPEGAIYDYHTGPHKNSLQLRIVDAFCSFCALGCPVRYAVDEQTNTIRQAKSTQQLFTGIDPVRGPEVVQEPICPHGRYALEFITAPDRQTTPAIKVANTFQVVTWSKAFDFVAARTKQIIETAGPDALALVIDPGQCLEDISAAIEFASTKLGMSKVFFLPDIPKHSYKHLWADPNELLAASKNASQVGIVNLGQEPLANSLVLRTRIERLVRAGARYLACDPSHRMIESDPNGRKTCCNIEPLDFLTILAEHTRGQAQNRKLSQCCQGLLAALVDVSQWFVIIPASLLADNEDRMGPLLRLVHRAEPQKFRFLIDAAEVNMPALADHVAEKHGNVKIGRSDELGHALIKGMIRGLYVIGTDPLRELPGAMPLVDACRQLELIVAHATFITRTASLADVIFPLPTWLETPGNVITASSKTTYRPKVLEPPVGTQSVRDGLGELSECVHKCFGDKGLQMTRAERQPTLHPATGEYPRDEQCNTFGRLKLVLRDTIWQKGTGKLTRRTELLKLQNYDAVHISSEDAVIYGIIDGEFVVLASSEAHIVVPAAVSQDVSPGWARMSNYFEATCGQLLWGPNDALSGYVLVTIKPFRTARAGRGPYVTADQRASLGLRRYGIRKNAINS